MGGKMKKIISLFTMTAFIVFSLSCYSTKNMRLDVDAAEKVKKEKILSVVMASGETIEFSKKQPGRILNESIIGIAERVTKEIEIDITDVEHNKCNEKGEVNEIITIDGKVYKDFVGVVKKEKDTYVFTTILESHIKVSIPISEVRQVGIEGQKPHLVLFVIAGVIAGVVFFFYFTRLSRG
jgi:hypothetical protein